MSGGSFELTHLSTVNASKNVRRYRRREEPLPFFPKGLLAFVFGLTLWGASIWVTTELVSDRSLVWVTKPSRLVVTGTISRLTFPRTPVLSKNEAALLNDPWVMPLDALLFNLTRPRFVSRASLDRIRPELGHIQSN